MVSSISSLVTLVAEMGWQFKLMSSLQNPMLLEVTSLFGWSRMSRTISLADIRCSVVLTGCLMMLPSGAFDLLGVTEEPVRTYKQLVEALSKQFAPTTSEAELGFQFGQRWQKPSE